MGHRLLPHHPALYHGKRSSRRYFEGWFFKHSSGEGSFAVIPGVYRGKNADGDIAFIQGLMGNPVKSFFVRYPFSEFHSDAGRFEIRIGENRFSLDGISLNIKDIALKAQIEYGGITPLETSLISPSIMGSFSYLPSMQCNHGVLSLRHEANEYAQLGGRRIDFCSADGYIEKDWGEAFPKSWIWMQCCDKRCALMCSIAHIPYGFIRFKGIICVLLAGGRQYRFATYNGSKLVSLDIRKGNVTAVIKRKNMRLTVTAENKEFGSLKAPTNTGMDRVISESISARYKVELFESDKEVFSGEFTGGGLELFGAEKLA